MTSWYSLSYWVDKYGLVEAVKEYAPAEVKLDPVVAAAIATIRIGELALEARVKEMLPEYDE